MPELIDVRYAGGFRVWLRFSDDLSGELDLSSELWGPMFEPLQHQEAFAKVSLDKDIHTIAWPNGADFSLTWLHDQLSRKSHAAAE